LFLTDPLDPDCFSESIFGSSLSYEVPLDINWKDGECKSGALQSPIDIPRSGTIHLLKLVFSVSAEKIVIISGNTLVDFDEMDFLDYYSSPAYIRLSNSGHSVMLDIGKCHPLYEKYGKKNIFRDS